MFSAYVQNLADGAFLFSKVVFVNAKVPPIILLSHRSFILKPIFEPEKQRLRQVPLLYFDEEPFQNQSIIPVFLTLDNLVHLFKLFEQNLVFDLKRFQKNDLLPA